MEALHGGGGRGCGGGRVRGGGVGGGGRGCAGEAAGEGAGQGWGGAGVRVLEGLAHRGADHYARAMDPARAEPRYVPPVAVASAGMGAEVGKGEWPRKVEGWIGEKDGVLVPDVPVVSAAPVPSSVIASGGGESVVGDGRKRGGWKSWIWKGE